MTIQQVTEETFPQALAVYRQSWKESHKDVCSAQFLESRDYGGYLARQTGLYLVCDSECVGVFQLVGSTLSDLYIHPLYQGMGYGRVCVEYAIARGGRRLTVLSTNTKAIRLYEKMGFRFTGRDICLKPELWEREMEYTEIENG